MKCKDGTLASVDNQCRPMCSVDKTCADTQVEAISLMFTIVDVLWYFNLKNQSIMHYAFFFWLVRPNLIEALRMKS